MAAQLDYYDDTLPVVQSLGWLAFNAPSEERMRRFLYPFPAPEYHPVLCDCDACLVVPSLEG